MGPGGTPFPEAVGAGEEVARAGTAEEDAYVAVVGVACGAAADDPAAVVGVGVAAAAAAAVAGEEVVVLRTSSLLTREREKAGNKK